MQMWEVNGPISAHRHGDISSNNANHKDRDTALPGGFKVMHHNYSEVNANKLKKKNNSLARDDSLLNISVYKADNVAKSLARKTPKGTKEPRRNRTMSFDFPCRMQPFTLNSQGIPTNWMYSMAEDAGLYELCELSEPDFEYQVIKSELKDAGLKVVRIERVQNHVLLDTYKHQMSHLGNHRPPGYQLNERYLYHGTTAKKEQICEEGLDMRLSRVGRFGRGTYFSDNPLKCIKYTKSPDGGSQLFILKCRVLLGDMKKYPPGQSDPSLKREPQKEVVTDSWKYYDSVKGQPKDYNEYVVYQNSRVLVEYIVYIEDPGITTVPSEVDVVSAESESKSRPRSNSRGSVDSFEGRSSSPYGRTRSRSNSVSSQVSDSENYSLEEKHPELEEIDGLKLTGDSESIPHDIGNVREQEHTHRLHQFHTTIETLTLPGPKVLELQSAFEKTYGKKEDEANAAGFSSSSDKVMSNPEESYYTSKVLSQLISEFMMVTNTDNPSKAKLYLQKASQDLNHAIVLYYEDL